MKITSKNSKDLTKILTLEVVAADYEAARKKNLAQMQRRADIPGFRKGKVPASMIEKFYGQTALGDAINSVVGEALQNYVNDKKLNLIGEPLPVDEKVDTEWKAGNDFTFHFELAEQPVVKIELAKTDEIPFYNITVSAEDKKNLAKAYKAQQEASAKAAEEAAKENPEAQAPQLLSDEEIDKKVAEQLSAEYKDAAQFRFDKDARDFCVEKAAIALPEKFLRKWLIVANEGKLTEEQIDKDFDGFLKDYRWQLVMGELAKQYEVKIEEKDLTEEAKNFARYQYAMYGLPAPTDEMLEGFVKSILQDQSQLQRLAENCENRKVIAAVKEHITVKSKKISSEKFRELK